MDFSYLMKTQPDVIKLINNSIKKNRLSQVFLFDGVKGTPKYQASMYLCYMLLCDDHNMCGECLNCKRLDEGIHPRVYQIKPTGDGLSQSIKKEQVDELQKEFNEVGVESGIRIIIIHDIDKATLSSANSLLKFLEEINDNTYAILLTENLSKVLQTIRSRSQVVSFKKIDEKTLVELYLSKGIDNELARILSKLTNNSSEGLEYSKSENLKNIITLVKKINESFFNNSNPIIVMNEDGKFLLNSKDKNDHEIFLNLLITITNDRLFYLLGKYDEMVFKETITEMDNYGVDIREIDYNETFRQIEVMLEYKERLNYNVNLELMYMDMFINCEG